MNWLKKFMTGRYGADQLSLALLVLCIILSVIVRIIGLPLLAIIVYIPLGLCLFRMLSKNINKRRMENYKFHMVFSPVYSRFKKIQKRLAASKTHKFFRCSSCKAELRLPKGKGNIVITCPKCKNEFKAKT